MEFHLPWAMSQNCDVVLSAHGSLISWRLGTEQLGGGGTVFRLKTVSEQPFHKGQGSGSNPTHRCRTVLISTGAVPEQCFVNCLEQLLVVTTQIFSQEVSLVFAFHLHPCHITSRGAKHFSFHGIALGIEVFLALHISGCTVEQFFRNIVFIGNVGSVFFKEDL